MTRCSEPLVSILTPTLNQARFLPDCLLSIRRQSYPRIEHLVKDGGSTDGTKSILEGARSISWESAPDRSQGEALNRLFEGARGEILGWVNSDDGLFGIDSLASVVSLFEKRPELDVVYGDSVIVDEQGTVMRHFRAPASFTSDSRFIEGWSPLNQPSTFIRRRAVAGWDRLVDPELELTLDVDLWLRLLKDGASFGRAGSVLAADREHPARKARVVGATHAPEWSLLTQRYGIHFDPPSALTRARSWGARVGGLAAVVRLQNNYQPAFPWALESVAKRAFCQIAISHSSLSTRASARS